MPKRNHIERGKSTWCGDEWEVRYKTLDEAFENMATATKYIYEDDPCAKCLRVIANLCLDEMGFSQLTEDE